MNSENIKMVKALTQEELNAIQGIYNAFNTKQPDLLDEFCTPDWKDIPLAPNQEDGPEGLKKLMSQFFVVFPDIEIIIHEIYGSHERAGVRASMSFTHNTEFLGIPATNTKVTIALHEFHHLKDGKLTHTWHLEDWFGLLMQSGFGQPKG